MEDTIQCYRTLDLEPGATAVQVRKAYVELAQVWQPERYVSNPALRTRAQAKRDEINRAYDTLREFLPDLPDENSPEQKAAQPLRQLPPLPVGTIQPLRAVILWVLLLTLVGIGVAGYLLSKKARLFTV